MALLTRPNTRRRTTTMVLATGLFLTACSEELQIDVVNRCSNPTEYYLWESWADIQVVFDVDSPPSVGRVDAGSVEGWTGLARADRIDLYDLHGEVAVSVAVPDGADQIEIVIDGQACDRLAAR